MKSTVVDESLSSFKPMYCSREYQASTRLSQQYEKSTSNPYISLSIPEQQMMYLAKSWHLLILCVLYVDNRRMVLYDYWKDDFKAFEE